MNKYTPKTTKFFYDLNDDEPDIEALDIDKSIDIDSLSADELFEGNDNHASDSVE